MTSELRAAAERLIKHRDGKLCQDSPYYDAELHLLNQYRIDEDTKLCANAYLSTHPTDGGEAISEAKCRELGFKDADGMLTLKCPSGDYVGVYFTASVEYPWIYVNGRGVMINVKKTMSQLRHLLAALGCESKETA